MEGRITDLYQVANIFSSVLMTIAVQYGFGRHIYYLTIPDILQNKKYLAIGTLTGYFDQVLSRASIIVFLQRLTPITLRWPQRVAWLAHVLNLVVLLTAEIGFGLQCIPLEGAWKPELNAKCYSPAILNRLIYGTGGKTECVAIFFLY